jgi:hypothetical protein
MLGAPAYYCCLKGGGLRIDRGFGILLDLILLTSVKMNTDIGVDWNQ